MDERGLVAGETLIDFVPGSIGPLSEVERFRRRAGGAPANVAVRLSDLDRPPLFWTRVGSDAFGEFLVDCLRERGVPDRFVERDPDRKTTLAFVSRSAEGDGQFSFYGDGTADTRLRLGTVPDEILAELEWVSVGGVVLAAEPARGAVLDLVERAADADCTVVFDPNWRPELWEREAFERVAGSVLERSDVVTATVADLERLGVERDDPLSMARRACERGPHAVFVTLGGDGAVAVAAESSRWDRTAVSHDGYDVEVVDATGAGDAFTAGVIAGIERGQDDLLDLLAAANAIAAASTTREGGMAPLPDPATVTGVDRL